MGNNRLAHLIRDDRRRRLRKALEAEDGRWAYCLGRVVAPFQAEFVLYGRAEFDARRGAYQALRHYHRLTRLAERWANKE